MSRLLVRALLAVAACLALPVGSAAAADYRVYVCQDAAGTPIPLDSSWKADNLQAYSAAAEGCAGGSPIALFMGSFQGQGGAINYSAGKTAQWTWTPPLGDLKLKALALRRSVTMRTVGGDNNATPTFEAWSTGPGISPTRHEFCPQNGCGGIGLGDVTYTLPAGTTGLELFTQCGGTGSCANDTGGERVIASVQRIEALVTDPSGPVLTATPTGTILDNVPQTGERTLKLFAQDRESGIAAAVVRLDGAVVTVGYPPNRPATCADVGQRPEFDYRTLVPCPTGAVEVPFTLPVSGVANGVHRLTVDVVDAAGNATNAVDKQINVANPVVDPRAGSRVVIATKQPKKAFAYGKKFTMTGSLVNAGGQPVGGAVLEVQEQLATDGASFVKTGTVTTDAAGTWTLQPKTSASKRVRLVYGDAGAELIVPVRAKLSITGPKAAVRRGGKLRLEGRVSLDGLPKKGVRVQIEVKEGKRWRGFESARVSSKGRWTFTYPLRQAVGRSFAFRVRLLESTNLASVGATSRSVKVRFR